MAIDIALSNNFAFGGANASVVFARPGARAGAPPARNVDRVVITGVGRPERRPARIRRRCTTPTRQGGGCTSAENGVELGTRRPRRGGLSST